MASKNQFTGLAMPVFTAFGWAGEETAINYALEQLESFIRSLFASLPRPLQTEFVAAGMSRTNQAAYLATDHEVESDVHILFYARPVSLEMQMAITDKKVLAKGLKLAEAQPAMAHRLITELGADWFLRLQQMQVDDESGEVTHYQDLFKDDVVKLDEETALAILSKAAYLNGEDRWITPFYLSRRFPSEQISAMGPAITQVMSEHLMLLLPTLRFFSGRKSGKRRVAKAKVKSTVKVPVAGKEEMVVVTEVQIDPEEGFRHVAKVKPLHLRRGFINMTPDHWPFFAINSRTETRPVTVYYDGVYDKDSTVWRMLPNDMARLVMSPAVHQWFEDNFVPEDNVQLTVRRLDNEEIQVSLRSADG
jgi:hypothetical protein